MCDEEIGNSKRKEKLIVMAIWAFSAPALAYIELLLIAAPEKTPLLIAGFVTGILAVFWSVFDAAERSDEYLLRSKIITFVIPIIGIPLFIIASSREGKGKAIGIFAILVFIWIAAYDECLLLFLDTMMT